MRLPRTAEETRNHFDQWAATYDRSVRTSGGPLDGYESSLAEAADLVPVAPGSQLLDIGIGTGGFAARFAERGARVVGVDISPQMLAECRKAHPDFELHVGGFTPIPQPGARFDVVTASFAFHEVLPADRQQACREMARVLKPGGHLCLLDIIFPSAAAEAEAARVSGRFWDPEEDYPRVGDLDRMLREAGFQAVLWRQTGPMHWALVARKPLVTPVLTERLELVPASVDVLQALLEGRRDVADFRIPPAWPEADVAEILPGYAEQLARDSALAPWGIWFMVRREDRTVVGDIGFKGPPDDQGRVDLGYGVLAECRRRGYAPEAAQALVDWAFRHRGVTSVFAECLVGNLPSLRVLEKVGMTRLGTGETPEGQVIQWEIRRFADGQ